MRIGIGLGIGGRRRGGAVSYDKPAASSDGTSITISEDSTEAPSVEVVNGRIIILEAA